jgi:hypothetical protein
MSNIKCAVRERVKARANDQTALKLLKKIHFYFQHMFKKQSANVNEITLEGP